MKFPTLILASALALAGTAAFAQNDTSGSSSGSTAGSPSGSGTSIVEKAKTGVHKLGTATKHALNKVTGKDKKDTQGSGSGQGDASTMGASGTSGASGASGASTGAGDSSGGSAKGSKHQQR